MRARTVGWLLTGVMAALTAGVAHAQTPPYFLNPTPESLREIYERLYDGGETIPAHLAKPLCGGWDTNDEHRVLNVLGSPGVVAKVSDLAAGGGPFEYGKGISLPGHESRPLGDIPSGMGGRVEDTGTLGDGFLYPETADGISTACAAGLSRIPKNVWEDPEPGEPATCNPEDYAPVEPPKPQGSYVLKEFQHPYFEDPPCLWRIKQGEISPLPIGEGAEELEYTDTEVVDEPHTEEKCRQLAEEINKYTYKDCRQTGPDGMCCEWCERYTCTDSWKEDTCVNTCPACPPPVQRCKPGDWTCVEVPGRLACPTDSPDVASCQASCKPPPPPPTDHYSCEMDPMTGMEFCVIDPDGPYGDAQCGGNCEQMHYSCNSDYMCVPDPMGEYGDDECGGMCASDEQHYGCDPLIGCTEMDDGMYIDPMCNNECRTLTTARFSCVPGVGCQLDPMGAHADINLCNALCPVDPVEHYTCIPELGGCLEDDFGMYEDPLQCFADCQLIDELVPDEEDFLGSVLSDSVREGLRRIFAPGSPAHGGKTAPAGPMSLAIPRAQAATLDSGIGDDPPADPPESDPLSCLESLQTTTVEPNQENAVTCAGQDCRCPDKAGGCTLLTKPLLDAPPPYLPPTVQDVGGGEMLAEVPYNSYFRKYMQGGYTRAPVELAKDDRTSNQVTAVCYGFYEEFDPQVHQTQDKDWRCTMRVGIPDGPYTVDPDTGIKSYYESQMGRGEIYPSGTDFYDQDPRENAQQRAAGVFDPDKDLWVKKLGGAFSFLNEKLFFSASGANGKLEKVLTRVDEDVAELEAMAQRDPNAFDPPKLYADSALAVSIDDTGTGNVIRWWNKQEQAARLIFHKTTLRVLLPPELAGLDFDSNTVRKNRARIPGRDPESEPVEIQMEADEAVIGRFIDKLKKSLLMRVEEEPIRLIVPSGSPAEFRARARQMCLRFVHKPEDLPCESAPQNVQMVARKLEGYADSIEDYRELRTATSQFVAEIREAQAQMGNPLDQWMRDNIAQINALSANEQQLEQLRTLWNAVHDQMRTLNEDTNMEYCANHLLSPAVYSFLDPWLPSRAEGQLVEKGLPNLMDWVAATSLGDISLSANFSSLTRIKDALRIPVLKPITVQLRIPDDPATANPDDLPDLPPVQPILDAIEEYALSLPQSNPGGLPPPTLTGINDWGRRQALILQVENTMGQLQSTLSQMNTAYEDFWKSLKAFEEPESEWPYCKEQGDLHPGECCSWNDTVCKHVEMDLLERTTRIAARPLIYLKDDFDPLYGPRGAAGACLPEDNVCDVNPRMPKREVEAAIGGATSTGNSQDAALDKLRKAVNDATMREPMGTIPSSLAPRYDVPDDELVPGLDVAPLLDILPPTSSSSASSS